MRWTAATGWNTDGILFKQTMGGGNLRMGKLRKRQPRLMDIPYSCNLSISVSCSPTGHTTAPCPLSSLSSSIKTWMHIINEFLLFNGQKVCAPWGVLTCPHVLSPYFYLFSSHIGCIIHDVFVGPEIPDSGKLNDRFKSLNYDTWTELSGKEHGLENWQCNPVYPLSGQLKPCDSLCICWYFWLNYLRNFEPADGWSLKRFISWIYYNCQRA